MSKLHKFSNQDVELVSQTRVFDGFFKIDKYAFRHKLFSGGMSGIVEREIFERGDAVAVLPYDIATDSVLLIEQIRIGAARTKESPWLLEVIAGMTDGSLDYEHIVRKEANEEAGLELNKIEFMLSYLSSPGGTSERIHCYFAETDLSQAGGIFGLDVEDEDIQVHVLPFSQAWDMLKQGEIDNAATVICMQWLALNRERIRGNG